MQPSHIFGPLAEPEGSYEFSSVRPWMLACVRPSVRNTVLSELTL